MNADLKEILKITNLLKEDFEMLKDGRWDMNYSDGGSIDASLDNVDKIIEIIKNINE